MLKYCGQSWREFKALVVAGFGICVMLVLCQPKADAALLVDYSFDEGTGTVAANSGTLGSAANGTLSGTPGPTWSSSAPTGTYAPSAAGGSLSINGGSTNTDRLTTGSAVTGLNGLTQMTVALWWNPSVVFLSDRLVSNTDGTRGFDLVITNPTSGTFSGSGTMNFHIQLGVGSAVTQLPDLLGTSGWQFLVVTWDGTAGGSNNVKFYWGDTATQVTQLGGTLSNTATSLGAGSANALDVGNTELNTTRNSVALFDDVRIYDSILSLSEIQALQVVPEPSSVALLFLGGMGIWTLRRKIG